MPISITGVGAIITLLEAIAKWVGLDIPEGTFTSGVNGAISFIGLILLVVGQLRRKDLKGGIIRK